MTLEPGQPLLHYRLVAKIGEGGMGEVWKALDTTLDREVAIKVLPQRFTADAERLARFEREAKLLASLNHPNIAGVYGLHEADGLRFLAMELVEGEDLAVRLSRGAIPLNDALDIARQVAEALEAAHECGIVHRDLKPANIQTTAGGRVKVLDFGLAKALDPTVSQGGSTDPSLSPTLTSVGSAIGVVLGTAAYMSPEQARGKPVDRRADIWAFGVVLYEMLVGGRLFTGETVSDTLAALLTRDPEWGRLPSRTPSPIRQLLRRCLERDPRVRLRDIGEARVLLESPTAAEVHETVPTPRRFGAITALLALAGIVAAAVAAWTLKPEPTVPVRRLSLASPVENSGPREDAQISPDGSAMAYRAAGRLWVQKLDQLTARPVTGGEGAGTQAWSPDGSALVFTVGPRLYRAPVGGDPELLADLPVPITAGGGLTWTASGTVVYATGKNDLFELPSTGGSPKSLLAPVLGQESDFHNPSALPGGKGIVYVVHRVPQGLDTLEVLVDGKRRVLYREEGGEFGNPVYSPTGHILFERSDSSRGIWAMPFSLSRLEATGEPVLVTAQGSRPTVSGDGTLLYSNVAAGGGQQLVVADREGKVLETVGDPMQHIDNATLSPDETLVAACVIEGKNDNLWLFDLARRSRRMLVPNAQCASSRGLVSWSRTEPILLYGNTQTLTVERRATDGTVGAATLTQGTEPALSPDGRSVAFVRETEAAFGDLWWMRLDGSSPPEPLVATKARENTPLFSPDGTLLAYISDETGRPEIYLRDFPRGTATWQVSDAGGEHPRWSPSGDHLFFVEGGGVMVDAEIARLPSLHVRRLTRLFDFRRTGLNPEHGFDVFGNGDRILIVREEGASASAGDLTLVTDWRGP